MLILILEKNKNRILRKRLVVSRMIFQKTFWKFSYILESSESVPQVNHKPKFRWNPGGMIVIYLCAQLALQSWELLISGYPLDPLFFFISRLNNACSPLVISLQINKLIGIKDIPFKSFQLSMIIYDQNRVETFFSRVYRIVPLRDRKSSLSSLVSDNKQSNNFFSKKCWIPAIYFKLYFAS